VHVSRDSWTSARLMDLRNAVNMVITEKDMGEGSRCIDNANSKEESDDDNEQNSDDVELAVDIIESVRLGSGARIPFLLAWCTTTE
jgi:hypothetical protein